MKSITLIQEGSNPEAQAMNVAISQGFNCFSKYWPDQQAHDFETERETIFYYSWKGEILEVVILKEESIF